MCFWSSFRPYIALPLSMTGVMGHIPPSSHPHPVRLCYNSGREGI
jgi:hypothetical protein